MVLTRRGVRPSKVRRKDIDEEEDEEGSSSTHSSDDDSSVKETKVVVVSGMSTSDEIVDLTCGDGEDEVEVEIGDSLSPRSRSSLDNEATVILDSDVEAVPPTEAERRRKKLFEKLQLLTGLEDSVCREALPKKDDVASGTQIETSNDDNIDLTLASEMDSYRRAKAHLEETYLKAFDRNVEKLDAYQQRADDDTEGNSIVVDLIDDDEKEKEEAGSGVLFAYAREICKNVRQYLIIDDQVKYVDGSKAMQAAAVVYARCAQKGIDVPCDEIVCMLQESMFQIVSIMLEQEETPAMEIDGHTEKFSCANRIICAGYTIARIAAFRGDVQHLQLLRCLANASFMFYKANEGIQQSHAELFLYGDAEFEALNVPCIKSLNALQLLCGLYDRPSHYPLPLFVMESDWFGAENVWGVLEFLCFLKNRMRVRELDAVQRQIIDWTLCRVETLTVEEERFRDEKQPMQDLLRALVRLCVACNYSVLPVDRASVPSLGGDAITSSIVKWWLKNVALRLFLSSNLEQRLFSVGHIEFLVSFPPNDSEHHVRIVKWLVEERFLDSLFDPNCIHGKVIARSKCMIDFLSKKRRESHIGVELKQILRIWRACCEAHRDDAVEAAAAIEVVCCNVPTEMFCAFLERIKDDLSRAPNSAKLQCAIALLRRLRICTGFASKQRFVSLLTKQQEELLFSPNVVGRALDLMWAMIEQYAGLNGTQHAPQSSVGIGEACLSETAAGGVPSELLGLFVSAATSPHAIRCHATQVAARCVQKALSAGEGEDADVVGRKAMTFITIVSDILSTIEAEKRRVLLCVLQHKHNLFDALKGELCRSLSLYSESDASGADLIAQIIPRVDLLLLVLQNMDEISIDRMKELWTIFGAPGKGSKIRNSLRFKFLFNFVDAIGNTHLRLQKMIFAELICPGVREWANDVLPEGAKSNCAPIEESAEFREAPFECFQMFYKQLNEKALLSGDAAETILGEECVWDVVFGPALPLPVCYKAILLAVDLLTLRSARQSVPSLLRKWMERVLRRLNASSSMDSRHRCLTVKRCIVFLRHGFIKLVRPFEADESFSENSFSAANGAQGPRTLNREMAAPNHSASRITLENIIQPMIKVTILFSVGAIPIKPPPIVEGGKSLTNTTIRTVLTFLNEPLWSLKRRVVNQCLCVSLPTEGFAFHRWKGDDVGFEPLAGEHFMAVSDLGQNLDQGLRLKVTLAQEHGLESKPRLANSRALLSRCFPIRDKLFSFLKDARSDSQLCVATRRSVWAFLTRNLPTDSRTTKLLLEIKEASISSFGSLFLQDHLDLSKLLYTLQAMEAMYYNAKRIEAKGTQGAHLFPGDAFTTRSEAEGWMTSFFSVPFAKQMTLAFRMRLEHHGKGHESKENFRAVLVLARLLREAVEELCRAHHFTSKKAALERPAKRARLSRDKQLRTSSEYHMNNTLRFFIESEEFLATLIDVIRGAATSVFSIPACTGLVLDVLGIVTALLKFAYPLLQTFKGENVQIADCVRLMQSHSDVYVREAARKCFETAMDTCTDNPELRENLDALHKAVRVCLRTEYLDPFSSNASQFETFFGFLESLWGQLLRITEGGATALAFADTIMEGLLKTMHDLASVSRFERPRVPHVFASFMSIACKVADYLFQHGAQELCAKYFGETTLSSLCDLVLFACPSIADNEAWSLCEDRHSYAACVDLVFTMCKHNVNYVGKVTLGLKRVFDSVGGKSALRRRWNYSAENEGKGAHTSFVGLVNQGATCYMNSLLQQFFMIPRLRQIVFGLRLPSGKPFPADSLLGQLKRAFYHLKHSCLRSYDAKHFVEACKELNLANMVFYQNDVHEFYAKIVDKIDESLKATGASHLLEKSCFGGELVYRNTKEGCPHPCTERTEGFTCLQLEIRGHDSILSSLRSYFAGERLDGDNRVKCDDCDKKYPMTRNIFVNDRLPNVLILHLKRFCVDYSTFETVKVNDRCTFPLTLDFTKFTQSGLEKGCEENPDNVYELRGILVHRGVANGGHYYSLIRNREGGHDEWLKFNDEAVSPFDPRGIAFECYGGTRKARGDETVEAQTNAYMLFYERANTIEVEDLSGEAASDESYLSEVWDANSTFVKEKILLSPEVWRLVKTLLPLRVPKEFSQASLILENLALDLFVQFCCRSSADKDVCDFAGNLQAYFSSRSDNGACALRHFLGDQAFATKEVLFDCGSDRIRDSLCSFILSGMAGLAELPSTGGADAWAKPADLSWAFKTLLGFVARCGIQGAADGGAAGTEVVADGSVDDAMSLYHNTWYRRAQYFGLVRDVVSMPKVTQLIQDSNILDLLVHVYLGESSPFVPSTSEDAVLDCNFAIPPLAECVPWKAIAMIANQQRQLGNFNTPLDVTGSSSIAAMRHVGLAAAAVRPIIEAIDHIFATLDPLDVNTRDFIVDTSKGFYKRAVRGASKNGKPSFPFTAMTDLASLSAYLSNVSALCASKSESATAMLVDDVLRIVTLSDSDDLMSNTPVSAPVSSAIRAATRLSLIADEHFEKRALRLYVSHSSSTDARPMSLLHWALDFVYAPLDPDQSKNISFHRAKLSHISERGKMLFVRTVRSFCRTLFIGDAQSDQKDEDGDSKMGGLDTARALARTTLCHPGAYQGMVMDLICAFAQHTLTSSATKSLLDANPEAIAVERAPLDQQCLERLANAFDVSIVPLTKRTGKLDWHVDANGKALLGAHQLHDRSGLYADVKTYVVDFDLPSDGTITLFKCQFALSCNNAAPSSLELIIMDANDGDNDGAVGGPVVGTITKRVSLDLVATNDQGLYTAALSEEVKAGERLGVTTRSNALGFAFDEHWDTTDHSEFGYYFSKAYLTNEALNADFGSEIARPGFHFVISKAL